MRSRLAEGSHEPKEKPRIEHWIQSRAVGAEVTLPGPGDGGRRVSPNSGVSRGRLLVALGLLGGVYVLALLVILTLVGANIALYQAGWFSGWLLAVTAATLVILIRALLFFRVRFTPPDGAYRVTAASEPALFAEIAQVATAMGASPANEVFLSAEANAYVAEDTWLLGLIRRKRFLVLGMGLVNEITVDELRAVLAHELGHYVGSDTRLGAVSYRGWESMVRAVEMMDEGIVRGIFFEYMSLYQRVTAKTSRQQEYLADHWAADVAGSAAAQSALNKAALADAGFFILRSEYLEPLADMNYRPSNLYVWLRFLRADEVRTRIVDNLAQSTKAEVGQWDTHPPLEARLDAIARRADVSGTPASRPASDLFADPAETEVRLTQLSYPKNRVWEEITDEEAGVHLMAHTATSGQVVVAAIEGSSTEIGHGREFFRLLAERDLGEFRARLNDAAYISDGAPLRPCVRAGVVYFAGPNHDWQLAWQEPVIAADIDIDGITDALLAGGDHAAAAAQDLAGPAREPGSTN